MASTYSLTNDKPNNGAGNGQALITLLSALLKLVPILMAGYAIYQTNIAGAQKEEANRVEIAQLKDEVKQLQDAHFLTRDDVKDILEPLKQGVADQKDVLRDIQNWLREHGGRGHYGD